MKRFIRRPAEMAILSTAILFLLAQSLPAQDTVRLFLVDKGWVGDTNIIEVRASNFREITAFQLSFSEINKLGRFASLEFFNLPGFTNSNYNFIPAFSSLVLNYDNAFSNGVTIPDGDVLFRIRWTSQPGQQHCYHASNAPIIMEFLNSKFESLPVRTYNSCEQVQIVPAFFNVFQDANGNCAFDLNEAVFNDFTIIDLYNGTERILKNPQYLLIPASEYGIHQFYVSLPNSYWTSCSQKTEIIDANTRILSIQFGLQAQINCPQLAVEISNPLVRRCIETHYAVSYENVGTQTENNAVLRITLDSFMIFNRASIPPSSVQGSTIEFNLGTLEPFQSGKIQLSVTLDCNRTVTGQTHCVKAEMFPKINCFNSPNWSGAHLEVNGRCEDGKVKFRILNSGQQNMSEPTQYWIVEDDIMPGFKKNVLLNKDAFLDLEFPANGKTYRLCVDQVPFHPGFSNPSVALEGCGRNQLGDFSRGFVLQFPEDEEDLHTAIDCQQSIGSFDPNDKTGWPNGYSNERYIEPDRMLDYRIRFQNTGNDTAFRVVVVDTLSPWFDLESFRMTEASHPYQIRLVDRILTVVFDSIYLPYRDINEQGSQAYFQYQIKPIEKAPLKTKILNNASIVFDFNQPIHTNTTLHTLSRDFIIVSTDTPADPGEHYVNIFPNPNAGIFRVDCQGLKQDVLLSIYNARGEICFRQSCQELPAEIQIHHIMNSGLYWLQLQDRNGIVATKKLLIQMKH